MKFSPIILMQENHSIEKLQLSTLISPLILQVTFNQPDPEPKTMAECIKHSDWIKWKEAIDAELRSL
jgi:hypothetical protein